jgi:hypothetical protein
MKVGSGCVANDKDHPVRFAAPISRAAAGYRPQRPPKLRGAAAEGGDNVTGNGPGAAHEAADFGAAPEDGLRMLAALGDMSSLEPDFADELAPEEASITIIDLGPQPVEAASLQARLEQISAALDAEAAEPAAIAFAGADEATIEIFEVGEIEAEAEEALERHRLLQRIADGEH